MLPVLTSVNLITPPKQPVGIQMFQSSNLLMLTVHKIYVCNCLVLFLLFLSFLSYFLHRIFFHFFHCVKTHFSFLVKHMSPATYVWVSGINKHREQRQDQGYHTPTAACAVNTDSGSKSHRSRLHQLHNRLAALTASVQAVYTWCLQKQWAAGLVKVASLETLSYWTTWPEWQLLQGCFSSSRQIAPSILFHQDQIFAQEFEFCYSTIINGIKEAWSFRGLPVLIYTCIGEHSRWQAVLKSHQKWDLGCSCKPVPKAGCAVVAVRVTAL